MNAYPVTDAFAASILQIPNPWFIVNEDYVVGMYSGRQAARNAKAAGLAGRIVSMKEVTFEVIDATPTEVIGATEVIEATEVTPTGFEEHGCEAEFGPAKAKTEPKTKTKVEKVIANRSVVEKPCRLVWDLADSMLGARRKDVIAAAEAKGVAFYTARTQYQLWVQVQKEMAEREAAAKK